MSDVTFFKAWSTEHPDEGHVPLTTPKELWDFANDLEDEDDSLTIVKVKMTREQFAAYLKDNK